MSEAFRNTRLIFHDVSVLWCEHNHILCRWDIWTIRNSNGQEHLHNYPRNASIHFHDHRLHITQKMRKKALVFHLWHWLWCHNARPGNIFLLQVYLGCCKYSSSSHVDSSCLYLRLHNHLHNGILSGSMGDDRRAVSDEGEGDRRWNDNLCCAHFRLHRCQDISTTGKSCWKTWSFHHLWINFVAGWVDWQCYSKIFTLLSYKFFIQAPFSSISVCLKLRERRFKRLKITSAGASHHLRHQENSNLWAT